MKPTPVLLALALAAASLPAQTAPSSFVPGTPADEAVIRSIIANDSADKPDPHEAADLDWENAFGIRYFNLHKRDAWFSANIQPQFKDATNTTLEVKVRFLEPTVAVADEYWRVVGQVYAGDTKPGPDRWGRTTYIFKKANGVWSEVMERVADLRSPYYKHFDSLPAAVPVSPATLASYAGAYEAAPGHPLAEITVEGDHLSIKRAKGTFVGIPTSATQFLAFDPNDLAAYYKITFTKSGGATITLQLDRADGAPLATATKAH
jgi:hypothetical protein